MTNKPAIHLTNEFFDGYHAQQIGLSRELNPYSQDTQHRSHEQWHRGCVASELRLEENEA